MNIAERMMENTDYKLFRLYALTVRSAGVRWPVYRDDANGAARHGAAGGGGLRS